ncbi:helix-turn-helix domain-containing protein [Streptomyces sp. NPDC058867]|uniref:helix-turn-helix domain-containing protein n=1 Tax=unclassified Streptomyces TaxID=2593676 RepID=UPI003681E7D3
MDRVPQHADESPQPVGTPAPPPSAGAPAPTPWHELPPVLAPLIHARTESIVRDMVAAIITEVPAYRRPLESATGRDLIEAIRLTLLQFAELVEHPDSSQDQLLSHFRELGRVEFRNGRTTDSIQAAFRVGARVGSRRYAEILQAAALPAELVVPLHEAVIIHISNLSNEAVAGFRAERLRSGGEVRRARRALVERLLEQPPAAPGTSPALSSLQSLAARAGWPLPELLTCVVVRPAGGRIVLPGAESELLTVQRGNDLVVIAPTTGAAFGPAERIRTALQGRAAALGPAVAPVEAWLSHQCARLALDRRSALEVAGGVFVRAEEELADLCVIRAGTMGRLLGRRALAPFAALPRGRARRLTETLEALLMSWGRTAPEVARALGIHPQTARRRLRQLDDLLGDQLMSPAFHFEALLALRTRAVLTDEAAPDLREKP